jgi:hypothetical protein
LPCVVVLGPAARIVVRVNSIFADEQGLLCRGGVLGEIVAETSNEQRGTANNTTNQKIPRVSVNAGRNLKES